MTDATAASSKWVGNYKLNDVTFYDETNDEFGRFSISSGSCGFKISDNSDGWYVLQDSSDCRIRDEYGNTYPIVFNATLKIKIDSYGSISDVDESYGGTSSDNTSTTTVLASDLTFGASSAVKRVLLEFNSGEIVLYTYSYSKK